MRSSAYTQPNSNYHLQRYELMRCAIIIIIIIIINLDLKGEYSDKSHFLLSISVVRWFPVITDLLVLNHQ